MNESFNALYNGGLLNRLKYRWKHECDPFPGEGTSVIAYSLPPDQEPILILRKLRALLFGYGQGWTFWEAFLSVMFFGLFD